MDGKEQGVPIEKVIIETKAKLVNVLNESNLPIGVMGLIVEVLHNTIQNQLIEMQMHPVAESAKPVGDAKTTSRTKK